MQRFHFPLASVLEWRRLEAEREELRLAQLRHELALVEQASERLAEEKRAAERETRRQAMVEADQLIALDTFRLYVDRRRRELAAEITEKRRSVAEQAQRATESRRAFRLIEVLQERRLKEWHKQYDQEQENIAAELHLAKHVRAE